MVTLPVPLDVPVPIFQLQEHAPSDPACFVPSPLAEDAVPFGVKYLIVHDEPGAVLIVADAFPPTCTGDER